MSANLVTREEVAALVLHAYNTGQDRGAYVRSVLTQRYPGIENQTMRVNGKVYSVLDYLVEDMNSYAPYQGS